MADVTELAANRLRELIGSGELLATLGSGALALPIAGAMGLAKGLPKYGTREGTDVAQAEAGEALGKMMYEPRTQEGRRQLEYISKILEKAKVPPYTPVGGKLPKTMPGEFRAYGKELADYAKETGGMMATPAFAVKRPGGLFRPSAEERLRSIITREFEGPEGVPIPTATSEWASKQVPRYLQRHAGTEGDPMKTMVIAPGVTLEQAMDKAIKKKKWEALPEMDRPPMGRAGEDVWGFKPGRELEEFLSHAGDIAGQIPPADLLRMDIPALFRKVSQMDKNKSKALSKSGDARQQAAQQLMADFPKANIVFAGPEGSWLRFDRNLAPEVVKRGLSVDTCFGDHCVASIGHGRPEMGYPGHVPVRDIVTGRNPLEGRGAQDTTRYIEDVLSGRGDIYSLRTPEGIPTATMEASKPREQGVMRSRVRDLMGKPEYLAWQRAQREAGVPIEQHAPRLPSVRTGPGDVIEIPDFMNLNPEARQQLRATVGGGKVSPPRGRLSGEQVETIRAQFPQHEAILAEFLRNPPHELRQYKGFKNLAVSPRYSQLTTDMLRKMSEGGKLDIGARLPFDFEKGGIFARSGGKGGIMSLPEAIAARRAMPAGAGELRGEPFELMVSRVKALMGKEHLSREDEQILNALTVTLSRDR